MGSEEVKKALQGGKASKKMKYVWTLRWSIIVLGISIGFIAFGWFMFFTEFDEVTGEPINELAEGWWIPLVAYVIIAYLIILALCWLWANLYWKNYSFKLQEDKIVVKRGVIGKRIANIPYERIQNVNIWKGILDRIFGISTIQIETAGGVQMASGGYGAMMSMAEGTIQGIKNPKPVADYILSRVKGKDGLGDLVSKQQNLTKSEKLELLEERLLRGDISEETYRKLKTKYE